MEHKRDSLENGSIEMAGDFRFFFSLVSDLKFKNKKEKCFTSNVKHDETQEVMKMYRFFLFVLLFINFRRKRKEKLN